MNSTSTDSKPDSRLKLSITNELNSRISNFYEYYSSNKHLRLLTELYNLDRLLNQPK